MRFVFLLLLVTSFAFGQDLPPVDKITDKQIVALMKEAENRGLTEKEAEAMLKARGYSDSDIAIIKERINRKETGIDSNVSIEKNEVAREQLGEISQRVNLQDQSADDKSKRIFGRDIFNNSKITFEPNLYLPTPPDYILGVDDELSIDISGYAQQNYKRKITPEGTIRIEHFAPIYLNGLSIDQAKEKIKNVISSGFAGLKTGGLRLDLTLSNVKTIKVTLMGDVESPGTYSVSSFATVFNALYLSGGPSKIGSFRSIQLLRNNKVVNNIDIYQFLMTGSLKDNVNLRDGDVIFVPVANTLVEVSGEIMKPYRFELKPSETLSELLNFAGGFTSKAYQKQVKIERATGMEKEVLTLQDIRFSDFLLKNGDYIEVGAIIDRFTNRVEVQGAVFRPGVYALDSNSSVGRLVSAAEGLREDAFRSRALVRRLKTNLDPELIPVNLDSVRLGFDIPLQREDILIIKSITEMREVRKVTIGGNINIPGEYDFSDNMTINDLVLIAGGLRVGTSLHRVEIARRIIDIEAAEKEVQILYVDLDKDLGKGAFILEPFDRVEVRKLPNYMEQRQVEITGQVNYPGKYSISSSVERISDLIVRAGGVKGEGDIKGAKYFRNDRQVAVDLNKILKDSKESSNLFLLAGDRLHIPTEDQTIIVKGEVLDPGAIAFRPGLKLKNYIDEAGGLSDSASIKKVYVRYANGHIAKTKSILGIKSYPKVEKGMNIIVPKQRKTGWTQAEKVSVITGLTSVTTILLTLIRYNILN